LHGQLELIVIQLKRDVWVEEGKLTSYALLCIKKTVEELNRFVKLECTLNGSFRLTFALYEHI